MKRALIPTIPLLLPLLLPLVAHAQTTVGLHTVSVHSNPGWNNDNWGAYIRHDDTVVGAYHNSMGRPSFYAAVVRPLGPFDLTLGVITGYQRPIQLLVAPSFKVEAFGLGWRLTGIPKVEKGGASVLHLSIEKSL